MKNTSLLIVKGSFRRFSISHCLSILLLFCLGHTTTMAQEYFECHTGMIGDTEGLISSGPSCWPQSAPPCEITNLYAPDADFPEHTPIKYVKFVIHIFQNTSDPEIPAPPGNFTSDPEHINVLRSWFHHPTKGINVRLAGLCDPEPKVQGHETPYISDSRMRFLFDGVENQDVFFYNNPTLWAAGWYCDMSGSLYDNLYNTAVTNNPLVTSDPNILNSVHVFLVGTSKRLNCGPNYGGGGYTLMRTSCGRLSNEVGIVSYGNFYRYRFDLTNVPPAPNYTDRPANEDDIPYGGNVMLVEFLHMASVDHPGTNHHLNLNMPLINDECADTPYPDTENNMMQTHLHESLRCALTQCQLGRLHHYFEHLQPDWQRTAENNFAFPAVTKFCTVSQPDIVIPNGANVVWERDRSIRSNIVVEPGGKLTIRCDVGLPKDARITVHPNGELYVDGARLHNNCDNARWDGIVVVGNSNLHQYKTYGVRNQGLLILSNGAVLSGANTAVRNYAPENPGYQSGGVIIADNTVFRNNLIGVDFAPYQNYHFLYGSLQGDLSNFANCSFLADAHFGADYGAFHSMATLRGVTGIGFQACTFANDYPESALSFADEKQYGILAVNSGFKVTGICFTNPLYPCTGYHSSTFKGFAVGIQAGNYGSVKTFSVSNTTFDRNARGIVAYRVDNIYAVNNTFRVGSALPNQNDTPFIGIDVFSSTGYKIEQDTFVNAAILSAGVPSIGVFINHSGSEPNQVYKNVFEGLSYANLSNGINRGSSAIEGLQYQCNQNAMNEFDFVVPEEIGGNIGVAEFQGASNLAAGNTFSTVLPSSDLEMHFLNHAAPLTYFVPPILTNFSMGTITLETGGFNLCPSRLPSGKETGRLSELERQEQVQNFYAGADAGIRGEAAGLLIRDLLIHEDSIQLTAAKTLLTDKGSLDARFSVVDAWLQEGNPAGAQQELSGIPVSINLSGRAQIEYDYFSALKSIQIIALQTGQTDAQMVSSNVIPLKNIAEAGRYYASVQAQILLNDLAGTNYQPDVILPSQGQQNLMTPRPGESAATLLMEQPYSLQVVPNPAIQEAVFHYRLPEGTEQAQIVVTGMDGKILDRISVGGPTGHVRWSTQHLKAGLYIYRLSVNVDTLLTGRLVIIR